MSSRTASSYFPVHAHSKHSVLDGMSDIDRMVSKIAEMEQPGFALTDHGNMGGAVRQYVECKKAGIAPFLGVEGYLLDPDSDLDTKGAGRFHLGLISLDKTGYQSLQQLVSLTHTRPRFNRFPRMTLEDLATLGKESGQHIALTTGCFFGLVQQNLVNLGIYEALNVVKAYAQWFPHTYVEVQNHNITHPNGMVDADVVKQLIMIADRLGLPVVAGQDSHYVDQSERDAHALMKRMVYGGADDAFPGDSFHLASTEWVQDHYTKTQWERVEEGHSDLLALNKLSIPPLDKYQTHVPGMVTDPDLKLKRLCIIALQKMFGALTPEYKKRLYYELNIIAKVGFANYFHLVKWVVDLCRRKRICVEARGSANGSLVCFALGITQTDPVKWDLLFDRFLAEDRTSPPDIDLDVEDIRRKELIGLIQAKFPGTIQIGTWAGLGIREEDGQGGVLVSYKSYRARQAEERLRNKGFKGAELGVKLKIAKARVYGQIQTIDDVGNIYGPEDQEDLQAISDMGSVKRSYGVHASALLLPGDDLAVNDYVPHMLVASSDTPVTQFDQDDVELLGLLKLDVLGQSTLAVMRICQELINRPDPTDFTWIPDDDIAACKILREGRTDNGVFHFEGYTKAKGGKEMGIKSTEDSILAMALFMPGCMDVAPGMSISQKDLYLQRRKMSASQRQANVTYMHEAFEKSLSNTYGAVVFQEQVLNIVRGLGLSVLAVNKFFKVVKDSGKGSAERNAVRIAEVRDEFDVACEAEGLDPDEVWKQTASFVAYGFNRAHAAGYGIRAYRCAYLKAYYPLEFMTALLQVWSGRSAPKGKQPKEVLYQREARHLAIKILPPDVNISGRIWTIDNQHHAIRKGLLSIKGVGNAAAGVIADNAPYDSIDDLVDRASSRAVTGGQAWDGTYASLKGTVKALADAGSLDELGDMK